MELAKSYEPHAIERKWYPVWESRGYFKPSMDPTRDAVLHRAAAAERHRHAAHGPRVPANADGRADPLAPDERRQHALAGGHRPCGDRHADRRRAAAQGGRRVTARARPRCVQRARMGVEGGIRRRDHAADAPARPVGRLVARAVHDGRGPVGGRAGNVRAAVRGRPDLSRQAARQLGPEARHGRVRPRSRFRGGAGEALGDPLSACGQERFRCRRNDPAGDDARRHRGRGESRRTNATGISSARRSRCR